VFIQLLTFNSKKGNSGSKVYQGEDNIIINIKRQL